MAASSALTRDSIFQIARTLPLRPRCSRGWVNCFIDINVGLDEVAGLIKRDVALTARLIRISNSVVYGGSIRIGAIEDALNRVGFSEVHRLVRPRHQQSPGRPVARVLRRAGRTAA